MIVISDTSPILNLAAISELDLLRTLYTEVLIPPAVMRELQRNGFDLLQAGWIQIRTPRNSQAVNALLEILDLGESEAIVLAEQEQAALLLIDERRGWKIASEKGIPTTGLLGVLAEAKKLGLIEACGPILDRMTQEAGFWIGTDLRSKYLVSIGEAD